MRSEDLSLIETSFACPEQYDVLASNGSVVGYLRLRHGRFTAQLDGPRGLLVFEGNPKGDGRFEDDERDAYIAQALSAIAEKL